MEELELTIEEQIKNTQWFILYGNIEIISIGTLKRHYRHDDKSRKSDKTFHIHKSIKVLIYHWQKITFPFLNKGCFSALLMREPDNL